MEHQKTVLGIRRGITFTLNGDRFSGEVAFEEIAWQPERGEWGCSFWITEVHPGPAWIYGKDPLDALIRCMDFVSILIRGSEDDGLVVEWLKEGDHCGILFPWSEARAWEKCRSDYPGPLPVGILKRRAAQ